MGTDCKSAAFSFGGSNPPAPTKNSSIRTGYWSFCFICRTKGTQGWIRTATATTAASGRNREELLGLRPAGCACRPRHDAAAGSRDPGSFSARLAQSTRAHQKTSAYTSTLRFLFCNKARLIERVDSNSCGAVAEDSAKTAQWAVFSSAARAIHPRPPRTPVSEPGTGVSVLSAMQKGCKGRFEQYRFILSPTDIASAPDL